MSLATALAWTGRNTFSRASPGPAKLRAVTTAAHPPSGHAPRPSAARRILVVEDDPTVAEVLTGYLHRADFTAIVAADGRTGLDLARTVAPALIVLDVSLPELDGVNLCRQLRAGSRVPVIMLTAFGEEEDRLRGLEAGADDYVTKPFSPRELILRIEAVLRRAAPQQPAPGPGLLAAGELELNPAARTVSRSGRPLTLTNREFELLAFLMSHPGRVFRREELMRAVWEHDVGDRTTITVHIRRLREKIEPDPARPSMLVTVWGVGYRFDPPAQGGAGAP